MRIVSFLFVFAVLLSQCQPAREKNQDASGDIVKNEVIVLGMIHRNHRTSERYGIEYLTNLIKEINPDYILTEIPPDRFPAAIKEYQETDTITESRVRVFPEYVDVVFPLTKEMGFEIIPTAGWTKPMADARRQRLQEISQDTAWAERWARYQEAGDLADSAMTILEPSDDPYIIHTDAFDSAVDIQFGVYNELFNDELGPGGWDNINEAHYGYIEEALNTHTGEGKRILITYGSAQKGWFLRQLRQREDIALLDVHDFLDKLR